MRILLDTHCLLHATEGRVSAARRALLESSESELYFSAISLWEIAKLHELGRITCETGLREVLSTYRAHSRYRCLELETDVLVKMVEIAPSMHRDPADQIIVASALVHRCRLMTDDALIRKTRLVELL